jgi:hypothetical protein
MTTKQRQDLLSYKSDALDLLVASYYVGSWCSQRHSEQTLADGEWEEK